MTFGGPVWGTNLLTLSLSVFDFNFWVIYWLHITDVYHRVREFFLTISKRIIHLINLQPTVCVKAVNERSGCAETDTTQTKSSLMIMQSRIKKNVILESYFLSNQALWGMCPTLFCSAQRKYQVIKMLFAALFEKFKLTTTVLFSRVKVSC